MRACGANEGTRLWVIAGTTRRERRGNDIAFDNKKPVKVRPMGEKIEEARLRLHDAGYIRRREPYHITRWGQWIEWEDGRRPRNRPRKRLADRQIICMQGRFEKI